MLVIIGVVLVIYGYISYTYPFLNQRKQKQNSNKPVIPEWLPQLQKAGGILFMVIGGLLVLASFVLQ